MDKFKLTPIENEGKRVLTTAQLAEAYETSVDTINRNFNRNKLRYI
ncbi:MAG: ORF6N domain-containing protein [Ruminococcus sp.]|nr:ORF6N domain-containing protein [Ruminococcus sp.]MDE7138761.1 ORF6N domain-containing protein [Ruminococcus sp.]